MEGYFEAISTFTRGSKRLVLVVCFLMVLFGIGLAVFFASYNWRSCPPCQSRPTDEVAPTKYKRVCYPSFGCSGKYDLFSFEYLYGWHVRYFGVTQSDNAFFISPYPFTPADCLRGIIGRFEVKSDWNLNESTFHEWAMEQNRQEQNRNQEETLASDHNYQKESFSFQEGLSGFCYSYTRADFMCGFRDEVKCYIDFEETGKRMRFILNDDYEHFSEFKHFIESIQAV